MVIVQFCGRLVQKYRACVVDYLGLGITCLIITVLICVQGIPIMSLELSLYSQSNLKIYLSPLVFKHSSCLLRAHGQSKK